jgi:hypothetical protein
MSTDERCAAIVAEPEVAALEATWGQRGLSQVGIHSSGKRDILVLI